MFPSSSLTIQLIVYSLLQEPITFFGESTGQLPAAFQTTAAPVAATPTNAMASSSSTALSGSVSSSSAPAQAVSANKAGPAAGQAQQTGVNVFGAVDNTGNALPNVSVGKMILGSVVAGIVGGAMAFA